MVKNGSDVTYVTVYTVIKTTDVIYSGPGTHKRPQGKTSRYDGTNAVWQPMKLLSQQGVSSIDMEGVNSQKRGAFKLGFTASHTPYYRVTNRN